MRRRMFSRSGSSSASAKLSTASLAPMVDMLTILVVAVLRTWSTDPPVEIPEANFSLPLSAQETPLNRGVTVDVGVEGLYVEGWRAGAAAYWIESDDVLIREVYEALQTVGGNRVTIRAHQDAPWELVGKVLFTAQQAGFENVELVAVSRASL
jgi:biopolymer transport protein ExbD